MEIIIKIELVINLILLLLFFMHMFQLNSYFFKKYMNWVKKNIKKVLIRSIGVLIPVLLLLIQEDITNIIAIIL